MGRIFFILYLWFTKVNRKGGHKKWHGDSLSGIRMSKKN